jgi:hypothetical protein
MKQEYKLFFQNVLREHIIKVESVVTEFARFENLKQVLCVNCAHLRHCGLIRQQNLFSLDWEMETNVNADAL